MLEYSWTLDADYTLNNIIASIVSTCTDVQPEVLWQKMEHLEAKNNTNEHMRKAITGKQDPTSNSIFPPNH